MQVVGIWPAWREADRRGRRFDPEQTKVHRAVMALT